MRGPTIPGNLRFSVLMAIALVAACGSGGSPTSPPPTSSPGSTPPAPGPPPSITSISPATGSSGGGAAILIVGTGFKPGAVAVFDGVSVPGGFDTRDPAFTKMSVLTPPHSEGAVDVVVTNPDGASGRMSAGFAYASQGSFNPNGTWEGYAADGDHSRPTTFTIENDQLVSASCEGASLGLAAVVPLTGGEFSMSRGEEVVMSGRIVSASQMIGTINFGPCTLLGWRAVLHTPAQLR